MLESAPNKHFKNYLELNLFFLYIMTQKSFHFLLFPLQNQSENNSTEIPIFVKTINEISSEYKFNFWKNCIKSYFVASSKVVPKNLIISGSVSISLAWAI